ncbi:transposase [Candidatus Protofrankia datiscae]|uniref:transposase n=1 Tax=Candidatus Protofrankia californiensis TaxID=1839754 RepID=UPI001041A86B
MTARLPCPPTPASVEAYAFQFDDLFASRAQRCTFRDHLVGLLLPRDRNTAWPERNRPWARSTGRSSGCMVPVGVPVEPRKNQHAAHRAAHGTAPATRPHPGGVLIIDDSGDRKIGHATAGVSRQFIGSRGGGSDDHNKPPLIRGSILIFQGCPQRSTGAGPQLG